MASSMSSQLQQMLQSAVQAVHWTYSLFWKICPQQGILVWGDGYYNGAIKTRKTVQPMEVSTEEASLQRSQQLRELYESLSASESSQPARRPCAALSPEDLTESEWFYLMCVSFNFPHGVGLPGKAFARRKHVWLTGANEADSKVFTRAILAKTIVCIPLMDGVVELGTTERVQEDIRLVQRVKSFFINHQHYPKPALSEHSTSSPADLSEQPQFHSPPHSAMENTNQADEEEEDDEDDDDDEEDEEEAESDSGTEIGRNQLARLFEPITQGAAAAQAAAEPIELMQLEMSEDIRLGSPDDGSNNLESDMNMLAVSQPIGQVDHPHRDDSFRAESTRRWQDQLSNGLQPPLSGAPQLDELTQEDSHYSQTVSTVLQQQSGRWPESSSVGYSLQSAFSKWNSDNDQLLLLEGTSQGLLKYILLNVPFLHTKYRDEKSPKYRDGDTETPLRKGTPQEELSANHVLAERRRREKLNERFIILRSLVPFVTKMDKASILGDTIEYVKQLRRRILDLETRPKAKEAGAMQKTRTRVLPVSDKRKLRVVEGNSGGVKAKVVDPLQVIGKTVEVSIIECDALLELQCPYREGLLVEIMQMLRELRLEITGVQSSSTNGIFVAELRAKVKENVNGKKASIVEVKRAIHQIIS
ncbi:hypothetical protein HHK36_026717 [Tetracentron sinense]|uniref:BHLH domain-containing protein n=1 Tax=Tetracentron sinense TaxID=13715 RepID=A0A835D2W3_TETSI|nr:hypothetical protein HHK36_026717 [Tetracentron sinense]